MSVLRLLFFSPSLLNAKAKPILAEVRIGSAGPYRFLVDAWEAVPFTWSVVNRGNRKVDGLLPASLFKRIYVDQTRSELMVQR